MSNREGFIIAVDAGTSMIKSVLFAADGTQLADASLRNSYRRLPGGGAEQDMAATWEAVRLTVAELACKVPDGPGNVAALAITGQGDGTWLIDKSGEPVGDGLLWLDVRAADVVEQLQRAGVREAIFPHTGSGLNACNQSSQLLWLAANEPERIKAAATAMHCKDWLYFKLTGVRATDVTEGVFTYGNFVRRDYDPDVIEALGMQQMRHLMPPLIDGIASSHPLEQPAAEATGLPAGLPVVLGYVDVACSAVGGGLYEPGINAGCSLYGSTGMHIRHIPDPAALDLGPRPLGYVMCFPDGRTAMRMQTHMAGTLNFDWLAKIGRQMAELAGAKPTSSAMLGSLEEAAAAAPIGPIVYHPYIDEAGERGPFLNPQARAQFIGLDSGASAGDLARAVYESMAYAGRHCFESTGGIPDEVRITGGGARSQLLRSMVASVFGIPVRTLQRTETGAAGAAMIAAVSVGLYPDIGAACSDWVSPQLGELQQPDGQDRAAYARKYEAYVAAAEAMPPVWQALAQIAP